MTDVREELLKDKILLFAYRLGLDRRHKETADPFLKSLHDDQLVYGSLMRRFEKNEMVYTLPYDHNTCKYDDLKQEFLKAHPDAKERFDAAFKQLVEEKAFSKEEDPRQKTNGKPDLFVHLNVAGRKRAVAAAGRYMALVEAGLTGYPKALDEKGREMFEELVAVLQPPPTKSWVDNDVRLHERGWSLGS
ncbi:MAG: hypothetical protein SFX19_09575 [Alphaproteobacteria bacterium]|nr:hypothetical protein [Alphaproteobacteria bacterium]